MEENEKQAIAVSDFTSLLYRKGYRTDFMLINISGYRIQTSGSLTHCLTSFLSNGNQVTDFILETHAPYEKAIT